MDQLLSCGEVAASLEGQSSVCQFVCLFVICLSICLSVCWSRLHVCEFVSI